MPGIDAREAGVAVGGPLHGGAHGVTVGEPDVVAHADLVAVVEARGAGQREHEGVDELDLRPRVVEQRGEAPPDADVGAHARVGGVPAVHRRPFLRRDHLERQLVVVAQEGAPLRARRDGGRVGQHLDDRLGLLLAQGVVEPRHDGEVEAHLALRRLLAAEVVDDLGRRLVGLGEQDASGVLLVDHGAQRREELVRAWEVLAVGALLLVEVGHGVEPEAVDAEVHPEAHDVEHRVLHGLVLEVEVGLVAEEPVPEELSPHGVEGPVGHLGVDEDDARVVVAVVGVGPDVEVAVGAVGLGPARLEPRVLVARVVHHEVGDDADAARVGLRDELGELRQRAELRQHRLVVGDVVAAVAQRRGVEGRQPQAVDTEPLQVVEALDEPGEVARADALGVGEGPDQHLVEDRLAEPLRIVLQPRLGEVESLHTVSGSSR